MSCVINCTNLLAADRPREPNATYNVGRDAGWRDGAAERDRLRGAGEWHLRTLSNEQAQRLEQRMQDIELGWLQRSRDSERRAAILACRAVDLAS